VPKNQVIMLLTTQVVRSPTMITVTAKTTNGSASTLDRYRNRTRASLQPRGM
jgi:hypothetical protein